jgi:hypothetical protein
MMASKVRTLIILLVLIQIMFLGKSLANINLGEYRYQNRLVLINLDSLTGRERLQNKIDSHTEALRERRIVILATKGLIASELFPDDKSVNINTSELHRLLLEKPVALIGLDGGVKARYSDVDIQQLFADIDSMPMRKLEIQ